MRGILPLSVLAVILLVTTAMIVSDSDVDADTEVAVDSFDDLKEAFRDASGPVMTIRIMSDIEFKETIEISDTVQDVLIYSENNFRFLRYSDSDEPFRDAMIRILGANVTIDSIVFDGGYIEDVYAKEAMLIAQGTGTNEVVIRNCTFHNVGHRYEGHLNAGAISVVGCIFSMYDSVVEDNIAPSGAGIALTGKYTTANISRCRFSNNIAMDTNGGAIEANNINSLNIANTFFQSNKAIRDGGAISAIGSDVYITSAGADRIKWSRFQDNRAENDSFMSVHQCAGGAIFVSNGNLTIKGDVIFSENRGVRGGALALVGNTTCTVDGKHDCGTIFSTNMANGVGPVDINLGLGWGGAVYMETGSTFDATNVYFTSNDGYFGSTISIMSVMKAIGPAMSLTKCEFADSNSNNQLGSIYSQTEYFRIDGCRFHDNYVGVGTYATSIRVDAKYVHSVQNEDPDVDAWRVCTIKNTTFTDEYGSYGVVVMEDVCGLLIEGCTFENNMVHSVILTGGYDAAIVNTVFKSNTADRWSTVFADASKQTLNPASDRIEFDRLVIRGCVFQDNAVEGTNENIDVTIRCDEPLDRVSHLYIDSSTVWMHRIGMALQEDTNRKYDIDIHLGNDGLDIAGYSDLKFWDATNKAYYSVDFDVKGPNAFNEVLESMTLVFRYEGFFIDWETDPEYATSYGVSYDCFPSAQIPGTSGIMRDDYDLRIYLEYAYLMPVVRQTFIVALEYSYDKAKLEYMMSDLSSADDVVFTFYKDGVLTDQMEITSNVKVEDHYCASLLIRSAGDYEIHASVVTVMGGNTYTSECTWTAYVFDEHTRAMYAYGADGNPADPELQVEDSDGSPLKTIYGFSIRRQEYVNAVMVDSGDKIIIEAKCPAGYRVRSVTAVAIDKGEVVNSVNIEGDGQYYVYTVPDSYMPLYIYVATEPITYTLTVLPEKGVTYHLSDIDGNEYELVDGKVALTTFVRYVLSCDVPNGYFTGNARYVWNVDGTVAGERGNTFVIMPENVSDISVSYKGAFDITPERDNAPLISAIAIIVSIILSLIILRKK